MSQFQYKPLASPSKQIRLIRLLPRRGNSNESPGNEVVSQSKQMGSSEFARGEPETIRCTLEDV